MQVPQPGDVFEGKYEIVRRLGAGGFANVFLAVDREIQREVAIKVLTPEGNGYRGGVEARFMTEARILATLQDPHTIRLFTYGQTSDGLLYMVFQYVAGTDLSDVLKAHGRLSEPVAVHVAMQVLEALTEAHAAGVLHRDLKPANVLIYQHLADDFAVKLLDFGIAKVDPKAGGMNLTKTGAVVGTPRYMAPEQVFGEPFGPSADVYSVGLVLFEMLAGRPAVEGDQQAIIRHHVTESDHVVPPNLARPTVASVLERMLAREPSQRYQSAQDARLALARAIATEASVATPAPHPVARRPMPNPSGPTVEEVANSRGRSVVVFLLSASVAAVLGIGVWYVGESKSPRRDEPRVDIDVRPELLAVRDAPAVPTAEAEIVDMGAQAEMDAEVDAGDLELGPERSGCGEAREPGRHSLGVNYGRSATVLVPKDYDPDKQYPLIVAFHPKLISDARYLQDVELAWLVDRRDFIAVGVPASDILDPWESADDLAVAQRTIRTVKRRFCVNEQRLYVLGHSAGAEMARRFTCANPASALAISSWVLPVGGAWCPEGSQPPIPTLSVMGRKDDYIPLAGGYGCAKGEWMSHEMFVDVLRKTHGCSAEQRTLVETEEVICSQFPSCEAAPFAHCLTTGGHNLDRSGVHLVANLGCGRSKLNFRWTQALDFFEEHGVDLPAREKAPTEQP